MLEFSEWAVDILRRADLAARRFNPRARVRLARDGAAAAELRARVPGGTMRSELVEEPSPGDVAVELGGLTIYVSSDVEGLIDVEEPHDRIVLKPFGSPHTSR